MVIEQMIDIPADHRLTIEVPREVPAGRVRLTFTPQSAEAVTDSTYWHSAPLVELDAEIERRLGRPTVDEEELNLFRGILRTQGAWKDNPWNNCIEDIRAMREEWDRQSGFDQLDDAEALRQIEELKRSERPRPQTVAEAVKQAEEQAAKPGHTPISSYFGIMKDHPLAQSGVEYQRSIRNEWD